MIKKPRLPKKSSHLKRENLFPSKLNRTINMAPAGCRCVDVATGRGELNRRFLFKRNDFSEYQARTLQKKYSHLIHILRKEVIQPHLPIRLPCYDFTPIIDPTFGGWFLKGYPTDFGCYQLSWCDGRCVQGPGTYSPRHADPRLLAIPASCRRVAAYNPN